MIPATSAIPAPGEHTESRTSAEPRTSRCGFSRTGGNWRSGRSRVIVGKRREALILGPPTPKSRPQPSRSALLRRRSLRMAATCPMGYPTAVCRSGVLRARMRRLRRPTRRHKPRTRRRESAFPSAPWTCLLASATTRSLIGLRVGAIGPVHSGRMSDIGVPDSQKRLIASQYLADTGRSKGRNASGPTPRDVTASASLRGSRWHLTR